jgi:hypothetical protein
MTAVCRLARRPDVEAALLAHYGVDVRQGITPRRLAVLVSHLPPGVVTGTGRPDDWTQEAHLLAGLVDAVHALTVVTLKGLGARGVRMPAPTPRPGASGRRSRADTAGGDGGGLRPVPGGLRGLAAALAGTPGVVVTGGGAP